MVAPKFQRQLEDEIRWAPCDYEWIHYLSYAPDFFDCLCRLAMEPGIETHIKGQLATAVGYFITPFDIIPEHIVGPTGYIDDVCLAAYVLNRIPDVLVDKHWRGSIASKDLIINIIVDAPKILGDDWEKLKEVIDV